MDTQFTMASGIKQDTTLANRIPQGPILSSTFVNQSTHEIITLQIQTHTTIQTHFAIRHVGCSSLVIK